MRRVILESPYGGTIEKVKENIAYARKCMRDSLKRGESPLASHLLYTQILNDDVPKERDMGINAGLEWLKFAEASVVYIDRGISEGMKQGIVAAKAHNLPIEYRSLF